MGVYCNYRTKYKNKAYRKNIFILFKKIRWSPDKDGKSKQIIAKQVTVLS